jgi:hypothetical protein
MSRLIHPRLAAAVGAHLDATAVVYRLAPVIIPTATNGDFGYEPEPGDPEPPAAGAVGSFRCQVGPNQQQDGKQIVVVDTVEIVVPWQVVFFAADAGNIAAGDELHIAGVVYKVVVPPRAGSFEVLAAALCQEVAPRP